MGQIREHLWGLVRFKLHRSTFPKGRCNCSDLQQVCIPFASLSPLSLVVIVSTILIVLSHVVPLKVSFDWHFQPALISDSLVHRLRRRRVLIWGYSGKKSTAFHCPLRMSSHSVTKQMSSMPMYSIYASTEMPVCWLSCFLTVNLHQHYCTKYPQDRTVVSVCPPFLPSKGISPDCALHTSYSQRQKHCRHDQLINWDKEK